MRDDFSVSTLLIGKVFFLHKFKPQVSSAYLPSRCNRGLHLPGGGDEGKHHIRKSGIPSRLAHCDAETLKHTQTRYNT